jgi:hypothetical protein
MASALLARPESLTCARVDRSFENVCPQLVIAILISKLCARLAHSRRSPSRARLARSRRSPSRSPASGTS